MTPFTTTIDLLLNDGELVEVSCDTEILFAKEPQEQDDVRIVQALIVRGTLLHPTGEDVTNFINQNDDVHETVSAEILEAYEGAEDNALDADAIAHDSILEQPEADYDTR